MGTMMGEIMGHSPARNIVYKYQGGLSSDEIELDKDNHHRFTKGDFISRHGKNWKVGSLQEEIWLGDRQRMPTLWVYLVSVSVN